MTRIPPPPTRPAWARFVADQATQTSTRSGILFMALSAGGIVLTEAQTSTIMAIAGAVAALFALIYPDRQSAQ